MIKYLNSDFKEATNLYNFLETTGISFKLIEEQNISTLHCVQHADTIFFSFTVDDVSPHIQSVPPVPFSHSSIIQDGPIIWSALSQSEKYSTKVLEMPYPLLYKICLTLDITRADGNDVRMLAYKLGISLPDLAILKQAAIMQQPDNSYFNSTSYVVLTKNHSLLVKDFVDIMKGIERDDIICLVNSWSK